jgi:hypothetical protein
MKTKTTLFTAFVLFALTGLHAQGIQRRTVAERVKTTLVTITGPLKLDASQAGRTDSIFTQFYAAQNKMMEDAKVSGKRPGPVDFQKILDDRDVKLKSVFTPDQYTRFKNEVEDLLRPQFQSHEDR